MKSTYCFSVAVCTSMGSVKSAAAALSIRLYWFAEKSSGTGDGRRSERQVGIPADAISMVSIKVFVHQLSFEVKVLIGEQIEVLLLLLARKQRIR